MDNIISTDKTMTLKIPSVFDGDIPLMTFFVESAGKNVECGRLWGSGGVLRFEGNADEAAKVFFEQVIQVNREYVMRSNARLTCPQGRDMHDDYRSASCADVARMVDKEMQYRAALVNLRAGMVDAKNTNIVDYIDAVLGAA